MIRRSTPSHRQQEGVALIMALIVLLAMTLAGALMLRNVGIGLGIAGNVAFKKETTAQADLGVEAGVAYVVARSGVVLEEDDADNHYSAALPAVPFDPLTFPWNDANSTLIDLGDFKVRYVVHRLCKNTGSVSAAGQMCSYPLSKQTSDPSGEVKFGAVIKQPFYRVTSRVTGPRNTTSYVQVVFY